MATKKPKSEQINPGQTRRLSLRTDRIDPKHLVGGKAPQVEAICVKKHKTTWGGFTEHDLSIGARVMLNHGVNQVYRDDSHDVHRLTEIAEDHFAPQTEMEGKINER